MFKKKNQSSEKLSTTDPVKGQMEKKKFQQLVLHYHKMTFELIPNNNKQAISKEKKNNISQTNLTVLHEYKNVQTQNKISK